MKLNHECIRAVLLDIEEKHLNIGHLNLSNLLTDSKSSVFTEEDIVYSLLKLEEAGYIDAKFQYASNKLFYISIGNITWEGHKFLDNIRDDGVWKDTKGILSKFSSTSISFASDIASSVITKLIEKQLGLN